MRCDNCGGQLRAREPDSSGYITCEYCQATYRAQKINVAARAATPSGRRSWLLIAGLITAIGVCSVGVVVWVGAHMGDVAKRVIGAHVRSATATATFGPGDLEGAPDGSWFPLDTAGMVGSLNDFDPVANYPWFLKVAQSWSPDVTLAHYGFAVAHLSTTTAHVDLTREGGEIDVRFFSRTRHEANDKLVEVSERGVPNTFRIWIRDGEVKAMKAVDRSTFADQASLPLPRLTCSMAKVLERARQSGELPRRPYYDARLHQRGPRWIWDLSNAEVPPDACDP